MSEQIIINLLSYGIVLPAAILCFFPMRNQLRFGYTFSLVGMISALIVMIISVSILDAKGLLGYNALMIPMLLVCFVIFYFMVKAPMAKAFSVFLTVAALASFISNIANGYDAMLHPTSSIDAFSLEAAEFQIAISTAAAIALAPPFYKYVSWLIDNVDISNVWYYSGLCSLIFLVFNLYLYPHDYSLMQNRDVFRSFWVSLISMFLLFLLLLVLFYYILKGIYDRLSVDEKNRLLQMEESQFQKQQIYMNETQAARHDFKHAIRTLTELFDAKDYDAAAEFLSGYAATIPQNDIIKFSNNNAVNAMMNYYAQTAEQSKIKIDWFAVIPERLPLSDMELCSMIGNILENAIFACADVPEEDRFIQFSAEAPNDSQFLIVATNSFSGKVRRRRGAYISTRSSSGGIGLRSITRTAESYGGSVDFSHEGKEFYTNVIIPISTKQI